MELLLLALAVVVLIGLVLYFGRPRPEVTELLEELAPIVIDEREGPLVHGGGLGDLRSSRQPIPLTKDSNGDQ